MAEELEAVPNIAGPIPFALSPAAVVQDLIDYRTKTGTALYQAGIKQLIPDKAFELTPTDVRALIAALKVKVQEQKWDDIFEIPIQIDHPDDGTLDLLTEYGIITMEQIEAHARTYIAESSRDAQNNYMAYLCLEHSLSTTACATIHQHEIHFKLNIEGTSHISAASFFKTILKEAYTDSNATTKNIRDKIAALPTYIGTISYDVKAFNEYVHDCVNELAVRGQVTNDLLNNLLKAYKTVPDAQFKIFITNREDKYDAGEDITENALMDLAQNKYTTLKDRNEWNAPTPDQEKLIALATKVESVSKALKTKGRHKSQQSDANQPEASSPGKNNGKKNKQYREPPAWKLKPPAKGESHTKKNNNKTFNWCKNHKMWTLHTTAECKGVAPKGEGTKPAAKPDAKLEAKKLKVNVSALMAEAEDDE
jgi:hypothetical protein